MEIYQIYNINIFFPELDYKEQWNSLWCACLGCTRSSLLLSVSESLMTWCLQTDSPSQIQAAFCLLCQLVWSGISISIQATRWNSRSKIIQVFGPSAMFYKRINVQVCRLKWIPPRLQWLGWKCLASKWINIGSHGMILKQF